MRIESGSTPPALNTGTASDRTDSPAQNANSSAGTIGEGESALAQITQNTAAQAVLRGRQQVLRPKRQSAKKNETAGAKSSGNSRDAAINKAEQEFKQKIGEKAQNKQDFHQMMKNIYGDRYNQKTVENLRQRALSGDFSFLPNVRFVSDTALQGNNGAYDTKSGTILLNEKLAGQANLLAETFAEEAGHHIDTFFGKGDAVGDEGELLRHALAGRELSGAEIAAIRAEDDSGTIVVDGKTIEVEFFFGKVFKGIKKAFKGIAKGISGVVGGIWDGIKKIGTWIATSAIGQFLVTAALAALSVVTAGVGTAAMIAWEAAKQAAIAVAKSVIVQKVTGLVGKVTGSETLGRIAGAIGSAFAGGKIDLSSTSTFTRTAGAVAKDIAVNEAKRAVKNEVLDNIGSPFLQMAAGYAVDYGVDAGADYAYGKVTGPSAAAANDARLVNKESSGNVSSGGEVPDGQSFDIGDYAQRTLKRVGNLSVADAIKQLAPNELRGVLTTIVGSDVRDFTVSDLVSAFKTGLNDFEGMSSADVAAAVQDYARNAIASAGEIDSADVARYVNAAFNQAGKLKVEDLVALSGYQGGIADPAVEYAAKKLGTTPAELTLNDVIGYAIGGDDGAETDSQQADKHRVAG